MGIDKDQAELLGTLHKFAQNFLPDEDYFSEFERNKDFAKESFEKNGELTMMAIIDGRPREAEPDAENVKMVAVIITTESSQKEVAMKTVAKEYVDKFPNHMPVMFSLVSEAWLSFAKKGKFDVMPSDDPDHKEVIVVAANSIDQRNSQFTTVIERDASGKFTGWGEEIEVLYKPGNDPRTLVSYRAIDFYREYFALRGME